jgi:Ca2+-binding EF-hand superfamily protein
LTAHHEQSNNFLQENTFAWVHHRDKNEVRIKSFDTIKRKLRAQAYSSRGMDYKHLFRVYDMNNDNGLELAEFRHALRVDGKVKGSQKTGLSDKAIERVFRDIDQDASGSIEYTEFLNWLNAPTVRPSSTTPSSPTAGLAFNDAVKTATRRRFRRAQDLEKQRSHLVEQWWNDLYGNSKKKKIPPLTLQTTCNKMKRSDPVFERLYPYKYSRTANNDVRNNSAAGRRERPRYQKIEF